MSFPDGKIMLDDFGDGYIPTSAVVANTQRFTKDVLRVGNYVHPTQNWKLDVTEDRAKRLVATFAKMRANGVPVKFTKDHKSGSDAVLGEVVEMWKTSYDDSVVATVLAVGDEAIDLCGRVGHVSIELEPEFKDGEGREYGEAITAVSMTPDPIVPGQRPFIPIAGDAKRAASRVPVLFFSSQLEVKSMLDFEKLSKAIGAEKPLTDENAVEAIEAFIAGKAKEAEEKATSLKKLLDEKVAEIDGLKAKVKGDPEPDQEVLDDRAETLEERIDSLIEKGKITPAVAASLKPVLIGEPGKRSVFMLSRKVSGTPAPVARMIIDALAQNDVVKLGEQTGRQVSTAKLSREVPGKEDAHDPEVTKSMVGMAYPNAKE